MMMKQFYVISTHNDWFNQQGGSLVGVETFVSNAY